MEIAPQPRVYSQQFSALLLAAAVLVASGCSSVAPSRTATGAGTGAVVGGVGGAVVGNNSGLGTGTGAAIGAGAGALIGGIVGMVQDAKDRKEQDRLAQERAYQQELAKKRSEEARRKAEGDEEIAIAQGFRITDIELTDAQKKEKLAADRLKALRDERAGALAKKKALDDARDKTLQTEAEIARLEEELARLKGEAAPLKASDSSALGATPSGAATAKPGL
jgi:outer membrane lipoprotein SlyB